MDKIQHLGELLRDCGNMVAFTGAGVSTESGVPDFRSSGGVYDSIRKAYGHPPEVLLSHSFFEKYPEIFFDYLRKYLIFPDAKPNFTHKALAALEKQGKLKAVVTQNIDGLHGKAGCRKVCELHGSVYRNYCVKCGKKYDLDFVLHSSGVPHCECGGIVRPDVVLYEEGLDVVTMDKAMDAISEASMLLVMGTSLAVYPAAGLLQYFRGKDLVLINKTPTPYDKEAGLIINNSAGKVLQEAFEKAEISI